MSQSYESSIFSSLSNGEFSQNNSIQLGAAISSKSGQSSHLILRASDAFISENRLLSHCI